MSRPNPFYPPSPRNVPDDLATPSHQYHTRVIFVLLGLIAFFGLYLFLIFATLLLIPLALFLPLPINLFVSGFSLFAFLFLVKSFFKRRQTDKTRRVEIDAAEHPRLFDFITRLCEETGAPFPHRIFLSRDVNACVFYSDSLLCLFWPTPKNLEIGLGLVNVLNLSEFKAVLAHEFGHFTQESMRLHAYVYMANRFMAGMVNDRDWFDDLVFRLRGSRSRLAPVGWVLYGCLWLFRRCLVGCYYGINFLSLALSRQMEFHADLVAVSVAGSDAIVHALSRLEFASESQAAAVGDLRTAMHHNLFTSDLFYHQNHAADRLRRLRNKPRLGEPPALPAKAGRSPDVFEPGDDQSSAMWQGHPPNHDREQNAKEVYIRCPLDDRSPWVLFDDPAGLRERVTWRFYRNEFGLSRDAILEKATRVQAFIDAEHAETTYDPRYHGAYDARPIEPGDLDELVKSSRQNPWKPAALAQAHTRLYGRELKERAKEYKFLREEAVFLAQVGRESKSVESFQFRGRHYNPTAAKRLLKKVERRLEEERHELGKRDRTTFLVHYEMSREVGPEASDELLARYRFHMALQAIDRDLSEQRAVLANVLAFLNGKSGAMRYQEFNAVRASFRQAHDVLDRSLRAAFRLRLPALQNMEAGEPLSDFLLPRVLIKGLKPSAQTLTAEWVNKFLRQMDEVREKVRRIHFKSLGGILALQERIAEQWTTELADVPEVVEAKSGELLAVVDEPEAERKAVELDAADEQEFELSEQDVVVEAAVQKKKQPEIELEELDPDTSNKRPRHLKL